MITFSSKDHKNCGEMIDEIEGKVKYVKLARSLLTYGVSFFLVKVRVTQSYIHKDIIVHVRIHS